MALAVVRNLTSRTISAVQSHQLRKIAPKFISPLSVVPARCHSLSNPLAKKEEVEITFIKASGDVIRTKGKEGDSLLDVIVNNSIDLDGFGACEGTLTCSTCHLIFKKEDYDQLPDKPTDEELDMLDLAYDLTETSRLGCQVNCSKKLNGLEVRVPATINDARSN